MDRHPQITPTRVAAHLLGAVWMLVGLASVSTAQIDPRTGLLEQAGWTALSGGRARAAAEAFGQALVSDPRNPRLRLGAGAAAYLEQRDADARAELEQALSLAPRMFEARMLLGHVHYRTGDLSAAVATLEEVVATASPPPPGSVATLERWRREAVLRNRMWQAVGVGFTVSFDGPSEEALATRALASLDRAYWKMGALLGVFPIHPIPVVVYSADQFADITQSPPWAAGAYDGIIRVPMRSALENPAELDRVLAHEFAHALVHALAPRGVPAWLNEGLATAFESDDLGWAERGVPGANSPVPLRALTSSFSSMSRGQARLAYATSALVVRRLLDAEGGAAMANLLRDLGEGADFDAAFLHRMHRPLAAFESEGAQSSF